MSFKIYLEVVLEGVLEVVLEDIHEVILEFPGRKLSLKVVLKVVIKIKVVLNVVLSFVLDVIHAASFMLSLMLVNSLVWFTELTYEISNLYDAYNWSKSFSGGGVGWVGGVVVQSHTRFKPNYLWLNWVELTL